MVDTPAVNFRLFPIQSTQELGPLNGGAAAKRVLPKPEENFFITGQTGLYNGGERFASIEGGTTGPVGPELRGGVCHEICFG